MEAPEHVLPPITSSQTGTKSAASAITRRLVSENGQGGSGRIDRRSIEEAARAVPPRAEAEHLTLAELEQRVGTTTPVQETDDAGWSPGDMLKRSVPQVRKSGASLAGAALKAKK
jgi:hypothetical protein